jgi:hypothetical protein
MVKKFITTAMSGSVTERVMANSIARAIRTTSPRTRGRWDFGLCWRLRKEAVCPMTVTGPGPGSAWIASTARWAVGDRGAAVRTTLDSQSDPPTCWKAGTALTPGTRATDAE